MELNIQTQKMIFNYVIENEELKQYNKTPGQFFDNKDINNVFKAIVMLYVKEKKVVDNPNIISQFLNENKIDMSNDIIRSILKVDKTDYEEEWIKKVVNEWKVETFGRIKASEIIKDITDKKFDKIYEIYKTEHILDRIEELDDIDENIDIKSTPTIDDGVFNIMPNIMKKYYQFDNKRERDVVFTGSLPTLSILFDKTFMIWDGEYDKPNLFSSIGANTASGKGKLKHTKELLYTYLQQEININEQQKLDIEKQNMEMEKGKEKLLFKPKYSLIQGNGYLPLREKLDWNGGKGLIHMTEITELTGNKKQEWGNYDEMLRQSFHNEDISSNRVYQGIVKIDEPYISMCMSGTFDQVLSLFEFKQENGLFSRFINYLYSDDEGWRNWNPFEDDVKRYKDKYLQFSIELNDIYNFYKDYTTEIKFKDKDQIIYFNKELSKLFYTYRSSCGEAIDSSTKRMGTITRKMLMIFTMLRYYEQNKHLDVFNFSDLTNTIEIHWDDLYNVISLAKTYMKHTRLLYNSFKLNTKVKSIVLKDDYKMDILKRMGKEFSYKDFLNEGAKEKISDTTMKRFLKNCVNNKIIEKKEHGIYIKK